MSNFAKNKGKIKLGAKFIKIKFDFGCLEYG